MQILLFSQPRSIWWSRFSLLRSILQFIVHRATTPTFAIVAPLVIDGTAQT